jgi:acetyl esterase/lipase
MKHTLFLLGLMPAHLFGQSPGILRDTSFTVASAAVEVLARYPQAAMVFPSLPPGVTERKNLVYASIGERHLHLDAYLPETPAHHAYAGVILIHGGGWRSGDRSQAVPMAQRLAAAGYVAIAVEYRLSPEARYPAALHDLKSAVRWLRAHARDLTLDTSRIAALGCSAGGHLAALLGSTNGDPRFEGSGGTPGHSSAIQAIVDIDGVLDLTHPAESGKDTGSAKPSAGASWLGATYRERPDLWREASPLRHVRRETPPVLFVNSSLDRFHAGRDEMIGKLQAYGIPSRVQTLPDTPHPFWLFHPWFDSTCGYVIRFLDNTFLSTLR